MDIKKVKQHKKTTTPKVANSSTNTISSSDHNTLKQTGGFSFKKLFPIVALIVIVGTFVVWRSFAATGSLSADHVRGVYSQYGVPADPGGVSYWSTGVHTDAQLVAALKNSQAYKTAHPTGSPSPSPSPTPGSSSGTSMKLSTAQGIVNSLFAVIIGRSPRSGELSAYSSALIAGSYTESSLSDHLKATTEGKNHIAAWQKAHPGGGFGTTGFTGTPAQSGGSKVGDKTGGSKSLGASCKANPTAAEIAAEKKSVEDQYHSALGNSFKTNDANVTNWAKRILTCYQGATTGDLTKYLKDAAAKSGGSASGNCVNGLPPGTKFYDSDRTDPNSSQGRPLTSSEVENAVTHPNDHLLTQSLGAIQYQTPDGKKGDLLSLQTYVQYWARVDAGIYNGDPKLKVWQTELNHCTKTLAQIRKEIQSSPDGKAKGQVFEKGVAALTEALQASGNYEPFYPECVGKGVGGVSDALGSLVLASYKKCAYYPSEQAAMDVGAGLIDAGSINSCTGAEITTSGGTGTNTDILHVFETAGQDDCGKYRAAWQALSPPIQASQGDNAIPELAAAAQEAFCNSLPAGSSCPDSSSDSGAVPDQNTPEDTTNMDVANSDCGSVTADPANSCLGSDSEGDTATARDAKRQAAIAEAAAGGDSWAGSSIAKIASATSGQSAVKILLAAATIEKTGTSCSDSSQPYPMTQIGDSGHCVGLVRWYTAGITGTKASSSLQFDSSLTAKVAKVQIAAKLARQDGVVDATTWTYFKSAAKADRSRASLRAYHLRRLADTSRIANKVVDTTELSTCADRSELRVGATGGCVKRIQELINAVMGSKLTANGTYDATVQLAVRTYQTDHDLQQTGTMTPETWTALETARLKPVFFSPYQPSSGTLVNNRNK